MGRTTSEALASLVGEHVSVITNDGRLLVGKLRGCDHATNVILEDGVERVYSKDNGVEVLELGVYVIRGDNIAVVGELDLEKEARTDLALVRGDPLKPIVH